MPAGPNTRAMTANRAKLARSAAMRQADSQKAFVAMLMRARSPSVPLAHGLAGDDASVQRLDGGASACPFRNVRHTAPARNHPDTVGEVGSCLVARPPWHA